MATFKAVVRRPHADGFYPVYIRVTQRRQTLFIKTDKRVSKRDLSRTGEIQEPYVLQFCTQRILEYQERLNRHDTSEWTGTKVVEFLTMPQEVEPFSVYARKHIARLINNGQERTARNYKLALQHLERYFGTTLVKFSQLTSQNLNMWVASLATTARAKEMYPVCVRQVYKSAMTELNDYENGIVRIKSDPWGKVKIPTSDRPEQKAITAEECRAFFAAALPESKMAEPLPELGRDVAMLCLCLGGINTVDLYNMRKQDYHGGIIHYHRAKTMRSRTDDAYMEMRVPQVVKPLFEKYRAGEQSERLFRFSERFSTSDSFCANVNTGIKAVCRSMGMAKEQWYCLYCFRHTWATTAQNDCGASLAEVGFAMNHSQRYCRVTRGYVRIDFTPAWELNERVVDFILFSDASSRRVEREHQSDDGLFRLSPKMLIRAAAFFRGRCLANFEDIGYSNIEEVTRRLVAEFPDDIPERSMVQFKIVNLDNGKVYAYEHQKGKGIR